MINAVVDQAADCAAVSARRAMALQTAKTLSREIIHKLYAGEVFVFRQVPEMIELSRRTTQLVNDLAGCPGPSPRLDLWQEHFSASDYSISEACDAFELDHDNVQLFEDALSRLGVNGPGRGGDNDLTHQWDRVRLRIQTHGNLGDDIADTVKHGTGRYSTALPIHRDTWGSNIMQQLNWWAPLAPISEERTLLLYPALFSTPVANTSREWDFEELKRRRADGESYPQLPVLADAAWEDPSFEEAMRSVLVRASLLSE